MNLNNLKISTRLGIGFGAVLLLLAIIVGISYQRLLQSQQTVIAMEGYKKAAELTANWRTAATLNMTRAVALAQSGGTPEMTAYFDPLIQKTSIEVDALQKEVGDLIKSDAGKTLFAEVAVQRKNYVDIRQQVFAALRAGDQATAKAALAANMLPAAESYVAGMLKLSDYQAKLAADSVAE